MEKVKKNRNYWLDNAKFFLIVLVVIGHFLDEINGNKITKEIFTFIYIFHMPLFIFIIGFFSKNIEKSADRITNYLIIYVIMQCIIIFMRGQKFTIVKPCYALWYLQAIIAYNLMLPIIRKLKPSRLILLSILAGLIIGFDRNANEIGSLSRIFVMLPFFSMGYLATEEQLLKLKNKKVMTLALIFLVLLIFITPIAIEKIPSLIGVLQGKQSYYTMKLGEMGILYRAIWYITAIITSFAVLSIIPKRNIPGISKFGTRTLQVYCLHIFVLLIFRELDIFKHINNTKEYIILISMSVILVLVLSLKIFYYPFKFVTKADKKLSITKRLRRVNIK